MSDTSTMARTYQRESDELVGVTVFGANVRIHIEVEGTWADGSSEFRPR
jgi:hypothetical protein